VSEAKRIKYNHPEVSDIYNLGQSGFVVITGMDLVKSVGQFALFQTDREAKDFIHAVSLKHSPKWHETECPVCRQKKAQK
jgi:hypothetical protein